jgi:hypothetical protein
MLDHESRVLLERRGLDLHGKRVLIVEDDYLTAECLSHAIADYGFTVVGPVSTADRAVRLIGLCWTCVFVKGALSTLQRRYRSVGYHSSL